jgi:hypothetical protein
VAVTGGGILASVDGASSARDSGVVLYRIRQRRATIVRQQVQVQSRPRGKLVVTSVQDRQERTLAQLYTDARGTLRLSSPKNALRPRGFDVDTGIAAGPIGDTRAVELRLMRHELWLVTDGRLVVRLTNLVGPRSGQRLTVRLGIDSYEGRAGSGPIRVVQDTVGVGTS